MTRDVGVIGGSAAGLFTALLLARKGLRVRVFEAAERLNQTPRTLIVTSRLRDLLGRAGETAVVNDIRRFELFTDGRVATVPLRRPDLIIERSRLVRSLAQDAEAEGAQVLFGRRFLSLEANGDGLTFLTKRGKGGAAEEHRTRHLVGADGTFSAVARSAGWPRPRTVSLIQAIVRLPNGMPPDAVRVWFIPADTPYFYWLIPESSTQGVVGLIGEDGQKIRSCLERFMERHGLEPIVFQGARIPVYTGWVPVHRQVGSGDVYLVGDAASQVKVTTVGGIVTGFRGALGVAEAILKGGPSRQLRALRRELDLHLLIRRSLHHFKQADYSRLLDLLGPTTRRSLSLYTRDEASKILWRLCVRQPRLLLLGIRALLTSSAFPHRIPT